MTRLVLDIKLWRNKHPKRRHWFYVKGATGNFFMDTKKNQIIAYRYSKQTLQNHWRRIFNEKEYQEFVVAWLRNSN